MGKKTISKEELEKSMSAEEVTEEDIKFFNEEYAKGDNSFICVLEKYNPYLQPSLSNKELLAETPALFYIRPSYGVENKFCVQCIPTHDNQGVRLQFPEDIKGSDGFVRRDDNGLYTTFRSQENDKGLYVIFQTQEQAINYAEKVIEQAFEKAQTAENPFKVYSDIYIGKEPASQDVMLTEIQAAMTAFVVDYIGNKGHSVTTEQLYNMLSADEVPIDPLLAYSLTQELATSDIIIDDGFFEEEFDEEIDEEEL